MELSPIIVKLVADLTEMEMRHNETRKSLKDEQTMLFIHFENAIKSAVADAGKDAEAAINSVKPKPRSIGLRLVTGGKNNAEPAKPTMARKRGPRIGAVKLTDEQLFGALSVYLATPAQITEKLVRQGIHVSKALIYARMPKLMADRPGAIETFGNPVKYRLKPAQGVHPVKPVKATTATKPRQPTLRKKRKGNPFAMICSRIESLLTDELKTVSTITDDAGGNGWVYNNYTVARALYYLEKIGVATSAEIDGEEHFARAD